MSRLPRTRSGERDDGSGGDEEKDVAPGVNHLGDLRHTATQHDDEGNRPDEQRRGREQIE